MFRTYAGVQAQTGTAAGGRANAMTGPGGWQPTVLYMLGLVVAEIVVAAWLSTNLLG